MKKETLKLFALLLALELGVLVDKEAVGGHRRLGGRERRGSGGVGRLGGGGGWW